MKLIKPRNVLIEKVAGELAATFYEIGRSQGLTSKYKTPRAYARANIEKFIPKAIEHLIECLNSPNLPDTAKEEIYDELLERANDKSNVTSTEVKGLPPLDLKKVLDNMALTKTKLDKQLDNAVRLQPDKPEPVIVNNPFRATRQ